MSDMVQEASIANDGRISVCETDEAILYIVKIDQVLSVP